jgi:cytoskeletal protein CcmA (bactofilin family)
MCIRDREIAVAIFGKKRDAEDGPAAVAEVPSDSVKEESRKAEMPATSEGSRLVVGSNVRLTGSEISDCDTAIVEGRVEATVDGRVMQITETGMFTGTVAIDMAEIRGQFNGELTVRKRLTVCGTGKVKGKIRYGTLVVEEGGELSGDVDSLTTTPAGTKAAATPPVSAVNKPEVLQHPSRGAAS